MKIGILKPDWGIRGGAESVVDRVVVELIEAGHHVEVRSIPVSDAAGAFGVEVPGPVRNVAPDCFTYFGLVEAFSQLDTSRYDVVISTQPPSFANGHPRHVSLFFHHFRKYYDLSDLFVAAGLVESGPHRIAQRAIREVDKHHLARVSQFLPISAVVARRLDAYNGLRDNVHRSSVGHQFDNDLVTQTDCSTFALPVCISRHEIAKRTELFVQAMKFLPDHAGLMVGTGGRLSWARHIDDRLSTPGADPSCLTARDLWLCPAAPRANPGAVSPSNISFLTSVTQEELAKIYGQALCVVAPAYLEDYGLTAIEAMSFGKPVIVCGDGGGLLETIEHGVNGLVVDPNGEAIAAAIRYLMENPELARSLGSAGRELALGYRWREATDRIVDALDQVVGAPVSM